MKNPSQLKSLHEFHNTNKCNKSKLKNYNKIPLLQQKVYSSKIEIYQLSRVTGLLKVQCITIINGTH